jgi:hypothetical protein
MDWNVECAKKLLPMIVSWMFTKIAMYTDFENCFEQRGRSLFLINLCNGLDKLANVTIFFMFRRDFATEIEGLAINKITRTLEKDEHDESTIRIKSTWSKDGFFVVKKEMPLIDLKGVRARSSLEKTIKAGILYTKQPLFYFVLEIEEESRLLLAREFTQCWLFTNEVE